ncbi:hypothetical protein FAI41_06950 [Acetobacteraceae bacterium]|nr:hypothetical protein FAI41_06950 [Acetobacteraceae bacterium]
MSERSKLQKAVLVIFTLGMGAGLYALVQHHFMPQSQSAKVISKKNISSENGISGMIGKGMSEISQWWSGTKDAAQPHLSAPRAKAVTSNGTQSENAQMSTPVHEESHKISESDSKGLSDALSDLRNDSDNEPPEVLDSHTAPSSKVLKQREKILLERRAAQEKQNLAIQHARAQEIKKAPKMLFAEDIMAAKKSLGFSPQGYHLWENANGFLITNPQNHRFELNLETETCAGALGQDTPELKQVFRYKKLNQTTESLTLYQANEEGQSATDSFACQVGLTFKNGRAVQATEKNCTYWHGAECAFSIPLKGLQALQDLK